MRAIITSLILLSAGLGEAQVVRQSKADRLPKLQRDSGVVYLERHFEKPVRLKVIDNKFPVFLDKNASRRLGYLQLDQIVTLEEMTHRAYRVRGKGLRNEMLGWVSPKAFASKDPNFVENLKSLYDRLVVVQELILNNEIALGMTTDEVLRSFGDPTERKIRRESSGVSGRMSWVEYEEIKHYNYYTDFVTGQRFRRYSHTTREEQTRTDVEFKEGVVVAIEESEQTQSKPHRIVTAPVEIRY